MNKVLGVLLLSIFIFSVKAEVVPVENFFKYSDINSIRISPDGKHYAARVTKEDTSSIVILDVNTKKLLYSQSFSEEDTDIGVYGWLNNERVYAHMVAKFGSLEQPYGTGRYFAFNIDGSKKNEIMKSWSFRILNMLPDDPKHILISRDKGSFTWESYNKAFLLDVYSGDEKSVIISPKKNSTLMADHNGEVKVSLAFDSDKETTTLYFLEGKKHWRKFKEYKSARLGIYPIAFTSDNNKLFVDVEDDVYERGIYLLDLKTAEMELVKAIEGKFTIDSYIFDNSPNAQIVGFTQMPGKYQKTYFDSNNKFTKLTKQIEKLFPEEHVEFLNFTNDGSQALLQVSSDINPGTFYRFDMKSNQLEFLLDTNPWIKPKDMAPMKPIQFKARDGLELYGYLTQPNIASENKPMVVLVHGGPYGSKDNWRFNSEVQFLANRGYTVLQINYRGSGGRGYDFEYDYYRQVGAEMQDDITDGTLWAVKNGYAKKDNICIYGASYGGYAAMVGVTKEPDLYQCAVAYAGVYDIEIQTNYSDTSKYESGRRFLDSAWNAYDEKFVKERSPLFHLDKLKAAIMLVHGEDDQRTPFEQYEALAESLQNLDYPYETIVKDDEGHGFYSEKNNVELYSKMAKFLDKHLVK